VSYTSWLLTPGTVSFVAKGNCLPILPIEEVVVSIIFPSRLMAWWMDCLRVTMVFSHRDKRCWSICL
jgi:hypothetical protein